MPLSSQPVALDQISAADLNRNFGRVQEAVKLGPVTVTHHGRPRLTILSIDEYKRLAGETPAADIVSRRKLGIILDNIREIYISLDTEWRFVTVNRMAEVFFGRMRDELVGHSIFALFPALSGTRLESQLRRVQELGELVSFEMSSMQLPERQFEVRAFPLPDRRGSVGILSWNATELKRTQERQQKLEQRMELMETAFGDAAIIDISADWDVVGWRAGAKRVFGWEPHEVLNMPFQSVLSAQGRKRLQAMLHEGFSPDISVEIDCLDAKGSNFRAKMTVLNCADPADGVMAILRRI